MALIDLKPFLDDVTDSFSAVLDLEMTIINAEPICRVSGTGEYRNSGWNGLAPTYSAEVLRTGKPIVALDTTRYRFRVARNNPQCYSLILYPITLAEKVEGVIVLASFTQDQQRILIDKQEKLLDYLAKTASLIAAKLEQKYLLDKITATNEQLMAVFESARDGLLLYMPSEKILQINDRAQKMLCFGDKDRVSELLPDIYRIAEEAIARQTAVKREVHRIFDDSTISLIVLARPIKNETNSVLCTINLFKDVQNAITQNYGENPPTEIVSCNPAILALKERIKQISRHSSNVLILGESGTGKELFARAIHAESSRYAQPFVTVNCAAIPEALLESELFGYEEGAFTGARKGGRIGKFMLANRGTLFLDEIGDMPLYLQAKLLRVLSDRKVDRIGSSRPIDVDIHIVAATNKNLEDMMGKKEFREDLYYRLSVIPLRIPPLRERREDIPLLIEHFIGKYNAKLSKRVLGISEEVQQLLLEYPWPGNVRELENCIEYMVNFEQGELIKLENLPQKLLKSGSLHRSVESFPVQDGIPAQGPGTLKELMRRKEREILVSMNARYRGRPTVDDIKEICRTLEISMATYYRKMEE
jgi:transcriptional regulator with PAS, ATPase and Fis domain